MKISAINIENYLSAKSIAIECHTPVTLIAGHNGSGKSSIRDAIQHALTGEASRVSLKKEYSLLVSDEHDSGFAEVVTGENKFSIVVPSGKGNHSEIPVLPYVLEAQRFAQLDENKRRSYLFGLSQVSINTDKICKQLIDDLKCNADKVERIKPMLRAGFPAAQKSAADSAKEAKGEWKSTTGGQTWGKDKAETWTPDVPEVDADKAIKLLDNARSNIAEIQEKINIATEKLGAARQSNSTAANSAGEREKLEARAGGLERLKAKLELDTKELAELEEKVSKLKAGSANKSALPHPLMASFCEVTKEMLSVADITKGVIDADGVVNEWSEFEDLIGRMKKCVADYSEHCKPAGSTEPGAKLTDYENSLRVMKNSVTNGERDIALAEDAKAKLEQLDKSGDTGSSVIDIEPLQAEIKELNNQLNQWRTDEQKYKGIVDQHSNRALVIDKAKSLHKDIMEWLAIADALSPSGIPGELLKTALKPINDRLKSNAIASWMLHPVIDSEMNITATKDGGSFVIPYALLSESEQWRVDAMIAEAISYISGIKTLVLDRFDVLDLGNRSSLIYWLDELAQAGELDSCIIFGTMKKKPASLPETITAYWVENGEIVADDEQNQEAA
ncbi:AAA domain-containing protein [Nitrosomonas marina]|uniref:AAA domain-containing protein n=1 Tax=Nitrosomonas marina TaxID=917 RepID=A0A1I0E5H3_9PROT|nr:AAA family ATPase [Nitrosomonas marina]SET40397.1 AAA domain-containing protein [Nitrosomonas marina]